MSKPLRYLRDPALDGIDPEFWDEAMRKAVDLLAKPSLTNRQRLEFGINLAEHGLIGLIERHPGITDCWKAIFREYAPTVH